MKIRTAAFLLASLLASAGAHAALEIKGAMWGQKDGAMCDASRALAQACNGKEYCQVYATNSTLCPSNFPGWKVVIITYMCDGRQDVATFAEGSQIALPTNGPAGVMPRCTASAAGGGVVQMQESRPHRHAAPAADLPGNSTWRLLNDSNFWIFSADGTCRASNGYWTGTWHATVPGQAEMTFKVGNGPMQTLQLGFSPDGRSMTAMQNGSIVARLIRER